MEPLIKAIKLAAAIQSPEHASALVIAHILRAERKLEEERRLQRQRAAALHR